jgi:hypothetical protein
VGVKIPDGLTVRISTNVKKRVTTIVAYRKGGFKCAYKAILPMCGKVPCREVGPHILATRQAENRYLSYHQRDVDVLVGKIIRSYR